MVRSFVCSFVCLLVLSFVRSFVFKLCRSRFKSKSDFLLDKTNQEFPLWISILCWERFFPGFLVFWFLAAIWKHVTFYYINFIRGIHCSYHPIRNSILIWILEMTNMFDFQIIDLLIETRAWVHFTWLDRKRIKNWLPLIKKVYAIRCKILR